MRQPAANGTRQTASPHPEPIPKSLPHRLKPGHEELRQLLARLEQGRAFVGDSFLAGNRNEEQAKALLAAAADAQKSLSPDALAARQLACSNEGAKLLANASAFSRAVVSKLAKNRMNKLLEPDVR